MTNPNQFGQNQQGGFGQNQQGGFAQGQNQQGGFAQGQGGFGQGQGQQGDFAQGQNQQGGFAQGQQGGFGQPQGQQFNHNAQGQGQSTVQEWRPDGQLTGFASGMPTGNRLKLSDHIGKFVVLRMYGIGVATINGNNKPVLECDAIVTDGTNTDEWTAQTILNTAIVQRGEALMKAGIGVTAGQIAHGEARNGNNAPIVINDIQNDQPQVLEALKQMAVDKGWLEA